jgi:hypothetical protein
MYDLYLIHFLKQIHHCFQLEKYVRKKKKKNKFNINMSVQ